MMMSTKENEVTSEWKIEVEPEGKNENNRNEGAAIVFLSKGTKREEVGAVAFSRGISNNPNVDFDEALDRVVAKAKKVLKVRRELDELTVDDRVLT
jgi:hypothetical protein